MCDTAFEIVLLGLLKLSKNVSLLKAALHPDLEGGQRSGANRLHIVYYTAASALALWLLFAIIQGNRLLLLRYSAAAKAQASVCLYWQIISFVVAAAHAEIKAQEDGYNFTTDWKKTWGTGKENSSVSVTATSVLALLIGTLVAYCCLLVIYYLRMFVIWRLEQYVATLPQQRAVAL